MLKKSSTSSNPPSGRVQTQMLPPPNPMDAVVSFLEDFPTLPDDSFGSGSGDTSLDDLLATFNSPVSPVVQHPLHTPSPAELLQSFTSPIDVEVPPTPHSVFSTFGPSPVIQGSPSLNLVDDFSFSLFPEIPPKTIDPTSLVAPPMTRPHSFGSSSSASSPEIERSRRLFPDMSRESSSSSSPATRMATSTLPSPSLHDKSHNGFRKGLTAEQLLNNGAPIQERHYVTPSVTSRKLIPTSVAKSFNPSSKRSASDAGLENVDKDALLAHIEAKRQANTLAARRSRQRKLDSMKALEDRVASLENENSALKDHNMSLDQENQQLRQRLLALGIQP